MHNLVPEFIQDNYARDKFSGAFPAAGLFLDITGFTTITDALMEHGPHGAEVLASLMRRVLEPLIGSIYAHKGMIVNFAGDAFTALFPLDEGDEALWRALAAGWQVQQEMADLRAQTTLYGQFTLSAKVGLAMGEVQWGIVQAEDGSRAAYYFRGSAIDGCSDAEHHARAGEIVLSSDLYARLGDHVTVVPAESCYRLTGLSGKLPPAEPVPEKAGDLEIHRRFFPESLLTQVASGEFRQVVNVFIGLPTVRTEAQLGIFMGSLFELQDKYGGLLNRLDFGDKGSNLLLFWGAPATYENDLHRALNFILELQTHTSIPINAGVTYQIAHAGFIGSPLREEYTCYGRGVNLAARFMSQAQRGEIWLDGAAASRAKGKYEIEHLGERAFKGFDALQPVYILYERKEAVEASFGGALVGRESELNRLAAFVEPLWEGKFAGAQLIWGDAGIGKSRLVHDFRTSAPFESHQALWAPCRADEIARQSFAAVRNWLHAAFEQSDGFIEGRNKRSFNRKLDGLIAATQPIDRSLADELDRTRSFLAALLDLHWPDSLYEQLDAQGRYENSLIALTTLVLAESHHQPVVVFLEDAQWLDEDSLQFLKQLLRTLTADERKTYPVAILANARREGMADRLVEEIAFEEINLESLSGQAMARLAEHHLQEPAKPELLDLLTSRAQGNPFFAEQILRYLQEGGLLERAEGGWGLHGVIDQSVLPTDVRAVLVARLDRLTQEVREAVQTAAVLGLEFEVRLLSRMLDDEQEVPRLVRAAERSAIWDPLSELRYLFRHALLRDAAYRMQVRARRQALHALAVESLERLYEADLRPHYAELAYHAERADLPAKALDYYRRAGETARDGYQNSQAVDFYNRALDLTPQEAYEGRCDLLLAREGLYDLLGDRAAQRSDLEALDALVKSWESSAPGSDQRGRRAQLAERWANYFINTGNYPESIAAAQRALAAAAAEADAEVVINARRALTWALIRLGKLDEARQQAETGLEQARKYELRYGESRLLNLLGLIALEQRDSRAARGYFDRGLAIVREINERRLESEILNNLGNLAGGEGDHNRAWDYYQSALQISQETGNRLGEGFAGGNLGWIAKMQADYDTAQAYIERTLRIARETGNLYQEAYAMINLSWLLMLQGDFERALAQAERCLQINRETGDRSGVAWSLTCLGHIYFEMQRWEAARAAYGEAVEIRRSSDQPNLEAEPRAGLARLAMASGALTAARAQVEAILEHLEAGGTLDGTEEPLRVYLTCYQVLAAAKDARAKVVLETAYRQLQEQAEKLTDPQVRRRYLEEVKHHGEIVEAWRRGDGGTG